LKARQFNGVIFPVTLWGNLEEAVANHTGEPGLTVSSVGKLLHAPSGGRALFIIACDHCRNRVDDFLGHSSGTEHESGHRDRQAVKRFSGTET
jgi:hypothetical protein